MMKLMSWRPYLVTSKDNTLASNGVLSFLVGRYA